MVPGEEKALKYLQELGFTVGASYLITEGIKKGLDIDAYADLRYDYAQMRIIKEATENNIDCSYIIGRNYSASQMETVLGLVSSGLYCEEATLEEYTPAQMKAIAKCINNKQSAVPFIKYPIAADFYDILYPVIQLYGWDDFSWVRSDMSENFIQTICDLKALNLFKEELLILSESELMREAERLKAEERDKSKFTKKNLSKFKIFSNYK